MKRDSSYIGAPSPRFSQRVGSLFPAAPGKFLIFRGSGWLGYFHLDIYRSSPSLFAAGVGLAFYAARYHKRIRCPSLHRLKSDLGGSASSSCEHLIPPSEAGETCPVLQLEIRLGVHTVPAQASPMSALLEMDR